MEQAAVGGPGTATAVKQPDSAQPGEIAPQVAKKKPPKVEKTKPSRKLRAGDLVCGECGEGNSATRKFCSRCGTSLAAAEVVKTAWWRKLIPRRKKKVLEAGTRPGQAGVKAKAKQKGRFKPIIRKVRFVLSIVLVLATVAYGMNIRGFQGWVNGRYTSAKDKVLSVIRPEYTTVRPVAIVSTDPVVEGNPVTNIGDTHHNTHWMTAPGVNTPTFVVEFERPVDIHKIVIRSGDSQQFSKSNRPRVIHVVYSNTLSQDMTLEDKGDQQTVNIRNAGDIDTMEFQIQEVHAATSGVETAGVAISEITFFTKK